MFSQCCVVTLFCGVLSVLCRHPVLWCSLSAVSSPCSVVFSQCCVVICLVVFSQCCDARCSVVFSQCCVITLFCDVLSVLCRHPVLWCSLSAVLSPCSVVFSQCCVVTLLCGVLSVLCRHPVLWCSLSAVSPPCSVVFSQCCVVTLFCSVLSVLCCHLFCGVLSVLCRHPVVWRCLLGHSDLVVVCLSHGLQDERAKYASPDELSVQYELPVTNPEVRGHMTVM